METFESSENWSEDRKTRIPPFLEWVVKRNFCESLPNLSCLFKTSPAWGCLAASVWRACDCGSWVVSSSVACRDYSKKKMKKDFSYLYIYCFTSIQHTYAEKKKITIGIADKLCSSRGLKTYQVIICYCDKCAGRTFPTLVKRYIHVIIKDQPTTPFPILC